MAAGKSSRVHRQYKTTYRIRNWREYERGLSSRGDVTIWLSEEGAGSTPLSGTPSAFPTTWRDFHSAVPYTAAGCWALANAMCVSRRSEPDVARGGFTCRPSTSCPSQATKSS